MCLIAISKEFFEMVLPNPELSVDVVEAITDFRATASGAWWSWALAGPQLLPVASVSLPLVTMGDDCRLGILIEDLDSEFPLKVTATPGRDLPAETGLSGNVVLRFGGVSREKSGGTTGWGERRGRGLGELGRDGGAELRPFNEVRPDEVEEPVVGDGDGAEL